MCVCLHGTGVAGGVATSGRAMFPAGSDGSIRTVDVSVWVVVNSACGDDVPDCAPRIRWWALWSLHLEWLRWPLKLL